MTSNEEEDEETTRTPGRPNAYWARVREGERGGFSSDFRGVNQGPHGGAQRVRPEDIIGDYDTCWCGLPADHDWPGKDRGRKHPKETRVSASNTEAPDTQVPHITRTDITGFSDSYKEIILKAVNDYRVRYRMSNKGILLYPHDGSQPYSLPMRENPRTLKAVKTWFVRHVADPETEAKMEKLRKTQSVEEAAQVLAETLNDPVEHPAPEGKDPRPSPVATTGTCPNCGLATRTANGVTKHRLTNKVECVSAQLIEPEPKRATVDGPRVAGQASLEEEARRSAINDALFARLSADGMILPLTEGRSIWHPQSASYENPLYEVDSDGIIWCRVKDCGFLTPSGKGASGHMLKHDPVRGQKMWGKEAQTKKVESRAHNRVNTAIKEAVDILSKAAGIEAPKPADDKALAKVTAERDEWKSKYDDLKAKLDLLKDL
jgi:hypothetical protein